MGKVWDSGLGSVNWEALLPHCNHQAEGVEWSRKVREPEKKAKHDTKKMCREQARYDVLEVTR